MCLIGLMERSGKCFAKWRDKFGFGFALSCSQMLQINVLDLKRNVLYVNLQYSFCASGELNSERRSGSHGGERERGEAKS